MTSAEMVRKTRHAGWAAMVEDRVASGLNIAEYCRRAGIERKAYYYRQKKVRDEAIKAMNQGTSMLEAAAPKKWLEIRETAEANEQMVQTGSSRGKGITLRVGIGEIELEPGSDMKLLSEVCRVLQTI